MVYKDVADPYLSKGLEENVVGLKNLVKSTMEQVHIEFELNKKEMDDALFQSEVISRVKESLHSDFFGNLDDNIRIWTGAREGIVKQYFKERTNYIVPDRYLKIAVKCNSEGESEVLIKDLVPWIDSVNNHLKNSAHKKYLTATATKKQALANLRNMLDFPISIKETPIPLKDLEEELNPDHNSAKEISPFHISEKEIEKLIQKKPEKYLPEGGLKLLKRDENIFDYLIVASNIGEYYRKDKITGKNKNYRIEGRVKSASEAMKWAKYIVGIRTEAHYDGIGVMEVVEDMGDIARDSGDVLLLKSKKNHFNLDSRFPVKLSKIPTGSELKQSYAASEDAVMELLKTTYLTRTGDVDEFRKNKFKPGMVYGDWIDMNLQSTTGPIEIQVKDSFGHLLYTFNSPFGHNSKSYNRMRNDELHKKVKIQGKEYSVDKIAEYIAKDVMLPAFTMVGRL